jgi:hypothetical protein
MRLFLAKQLASHPIINRQKITTTNGNTLYPSQQKSGPSLSQTTTTNHNFTQQSGTATILPQNKNLTNIKFTKEEIVLLNYGLQYSIERPLTTYCTSLIIETERAIKFLDTKLKNSNHIIAANKLKQILNSGNHYNILQKRRLYITKQLNKKLVTENAILVQADKSKA